MKQYLSVSEAATELGTSEAHIRNLVKGIRSATPERYHDSDIIGRGKIAVRFVTLVDFANYGDDLRTAPPYKPLELERELGIGQPAVNPHDLAIEVVRTVIGMVGRDNGMRTISIYSRPYINVESDGIIYACQIYGEDSDTPYFFFDGARHELTDEEKGGVEMPYVKKESIPCIDRRPCKYRDGRGVCSLLTTPYLKNGRCPWCKADEEKPTKKPELSPGEIVDRYLNLKPTERHAPSCIFYQGADRRLCRATSNTSCKGCAFYSANKAARTEALAKLLLDSEEEQRKLRHKVVALEWLLKQEKNFARIGRAVTKWRGQHGQNKTGT